MPEQIPQRLPSAATHRPRPEWPSKYLNGSYPDGYTLSGVYTAIAIDPSGSIGGTGFVGGTAHQYSILNLGRIATSASLASGIELQAGGTITNGSSSDTSAFVGGAVGF